MDRKVFRLRLLPEYADRQDVTRILSRALGLNSSTIQIISLAFSVDPLVSSKVATLRFNDFDQARPILEEEDKRPNVTKRSLKGDDEWIIDADLRRPLVMDTHFRGFTPLYDPGSRLKVHMADCIAISGLGSHPFGSWQPRGDSKDFMWIRDMLPSSLPNVRPILYGYDTTVVDSHSFQSIRDLAIALVQHLKANGWSSPTCKPISFLAHSLGGIVLKEAFGVIANHNENDNPIRQAIRGAVFFGVPNFGMEQSHLAAVVKDQPNAELVAHLKVDSEYLQGLDKKFSGLSYLQNCLLYWGYETEKSPTLALNSKGKWSRTGPREILVTPQSATRGLYEENKKSDTIFPIDEDHSNMVKFSQDDAVYPIVVEKLAEILPLKETMPTLINDVSLSKLNQSATQTVMDPSRVVGGGLTYEVILSSLRAPERDSRLGEIEEKFKNTFDWVYDRQEPGFSKWLEQGTGLFWINGKPGSGKSTLMKFIFQDKRTSDLLQNWRLGETFIRVAFFFHYRGTSTQKSFEGLLRSVLSQIITERPELCKFLQSSFKQMGSLTSEDWSLSILQKGLHSILAQEEEPLHLCLFLDAIDEYDGHKESICQFLQDLGNIRSKPNKVIKICFSSRPWGVFMRNFRRCPGFRIHDFTQADIRDYSLGSLMEENLSAAALEILIPYLVTLSRGVFLWVKLVIKDLTKAVGVSAMSKFELEKRLESYPTELDSYYIEIIERIPHMYRWKAYAMLEIAVRSKHVLSPKAFTCAVSCSEFKTYEKVNHVIENLIDRSMEDWAAYVSMQSKIFCGGLIEVLLGEEGHYIQVLHQTVEDFVMNPRFKELVLGDQAKITVENGNAFLAKYYLLSNADALKHGNYARSFEKTTGRSIKAFLDTCPSYVFNPPRIPPSIPGCYSRPETPLAYAASVGLRLYITESLAVNPNLLRDTSEPLLTYIVGLVKRLISMHEDFVETAKLLLERGFALDKDPTVFSDIIYGLQWRSEDDLARDSQLELLAELLLNHGQDPNVDVIFYEAAQKHILFWAEDVENSIICKPLHVCPPKLARLLLDKGAQVNALNSKQMTPLDQIGWNPITDHRGLQKHEEYRPWHSRNITLLEAYELTRILVSRGGEMKKMRKSTMKRYLLEFERRGWSTEEIRASLFPPLALRESIVSKFKRFQSPSGRS